MKTLLKSLNSFKEKLGFWTTVAMSNLFLVFYKVFSESKLQNVTIQTVDNRRKYISFSWLGNYYSGNRESFIEWFSNVLASIAIINEFELDVNYSFFNNNEKRVRSKKILKLDLNRNINIFIMFNRTDKVNREFRTDSLHTNFQNLLRYMVQMFLLYERKYIDRTQNYDSVKDVIDSIYSESSEASNSININKFTKLVNNSFPKYISIKFPIISEFKDEDIMQSLYFMAKSFKEKIRKIDKDYIAEVDDALSTFNDLDNENIEGFLSGRYRQMKIADLNEKIERLRSQPSSSSAANSREEMIERLQRELEQELEDNENNLPYDKIFAKGISSYKKFKK